MKIGNELKLYKDHSKFQNLYMKNVSFYVRIIIAAKVTLLVRTTDDIYHSLNENWRTNRPDGR